MFFADEERMNISYCINAAKTFDIEYQASNVAWLNS